MALIQSLQDFAGAIGAAATKAPDEYVPSSGWTFESHMVDLKRLWSTIRPLIKRDYARAELIDGKLEEMFSAFSAGDKQRGRDAAWSIYNLGLEKLR